MSRNTYAKPTTTNASFMKVPMNLSTTGGVETLTWGDIVNALPLLKKDGSLPVKAIKLGAITVGGSPDQPAHLEFKGGQTFDLPALATKPMRVKASEKNLYVTGWRRVTLENGALKVYSNTDDDDLTSSVVIRYQGQLAYLEIAIRFNDDAGYRPWYTGGSLPEGPFDTYHMASNVQTVGDNQIAYAYRTLLVYREIDLFVVGEELPFASESEAQALLSSGPLYNVVQGNTFAEKLSGYYDSASYVPAGVAGIVTNGQSAVTVLKTF